MKVPGKEHLEPSERQRIAVEIRKSFILASWSGAKVSVRMMELEKNVGVFDLTVRPTGRHLDHEAVVHIEADLKSRPTVRLIEVDLSDIQTAGTSGFAGLVVIRQRLLSLGGDMRVTGLHGKALALYHFIRLRPILPIVWAMDDTHF